VASPLLGISEMEERRVSNDLIISRTRAAIQFNEHIAEDGPTVFAQACRLGAEGIVSKRVDGT
jgi:ATP-dependent DNA ligase